MHAKTNGGRFVIGAWWGGDGDTTSTDAAPIPQRHARFGASGQYVLSGQLGSAYGTTYEGTSSSNVSAKAP